MIPHSGFSMNRNDRIVGIDGTAHGRMNTSDSHLIQVLARMKNPDSTSAAMNLRLTATTRKISVFSTVFGNTGSSSSLA